MSILSKPISFGNSAKGNRGHNRVLYYVLSLLLPAMVMTLAVLALGIAPFGLGKHNLAITDAKFYLNGEMFFKRLLQEQENIFYSFNNGLGGNEWSQFAWGGFGFGNLLAVFATLENIPSLFTWICVFNVALCGLTMYILLAYVNGPKLSNLIFSTSYALIGFNVANVYQTGFFLGPQLLPLVLLGLILIIRGKNPLLYILSLAFCVFFNFYFGFHLCVFSAIFFMAALYVRRDTLKGRRGRLFFTWAISSLIAGLLAAPMWLPTLKAYSGGGRLDQTGLGEYTFSENMPFIQIFSKLFSGANSTNELVIGLPNIFCGILVVALVILYFMNRQIDVRRKRAAGVVLAVYLLSFYITAFTLAMHGGTHTNWFPYRYSYVFSFLLIGLAVEEFQYLDEITLEDTKRCGAALLIGTVLVFSTRYEFVSGGAVVLDLALLLLMWVGFWFYKTRPERAPMKVLSIFLLLVVCGNLYGNFILSTKSVQKWELDLEEYNKNTFRSGVLVDAVNGAEDGFFRMEKDKSESDSVGADPMLYNYNGVSHSGPTERMFVHKQLNRLGINWFDMRHWYSEGVPAATDALLGLKYLISERDLTEEKGYENKVNVEGSTLYLNANALPVSILSEAPVLDVALGENVFDNLNGVWRAMTGMETDIFTPMEDVTFTARHAIADESVNSRELVDFFEEKDAEDGDAEDEEKSKQTHIEFSFVANQDGPVYRFDTSVPGSPNGLPEPAIKYCGYYHAGETVTGKIPIYNSAYITDDLLRGHCANLAFATADDGVLAEYAALLNSRDISFNADREDDLTGAFTAEPGQRILFTIPWDEGWTCYIDGEKAPIDKTWDLFMSVEAPEGSHTWEMKFIPAWLNYGLMLCGAAFAGLIVLMIAWSIRSKKDDATAMNAASEVAE